MKDTRKKISERMDRLQEMMESNFHLEDPANAAMHLNSVSKFWSLLSEEDKDYIQCAQDAIEDGIEWKL